MTETNEPQNQPPRTPDFSPPQSPAAPNPNQQQYPPYPNAQPYPNVQVPYGSAPYGSAPYGNYGPYSGGPYGYPQGYYAQPPGTNGMAIASLVLGICGFLCVTPFVGIGLGIAALMRIKQTGQSGKGMAIAGIILSSLWILLLILAIATGNFHFTVGNSNPGPSVGQTQAPDGTSA